MPPATIVIVVIIIGVVAAVGFWGVGKFNVLVQLRNAFKNAFAQVDVQLKRRYDLIPNLVATAKATQANVRFAGNPTDPAAMRDLAQAESGLSGALGKLMVVSEKYPELKADASMRTLMEELASTESQIASSRQSYNASVLSYNNSREIFPQSFIANMFGFAAAEFFKIAEAETASPTVKF
jgi:LemA protein